MALQPRLALVLLDELREADIRPERQLDAFDVGAEPVGRDLRLVEDARPQVGAEGVGGLTAPLADGVADDRLAGRVERHEHVLVAQLAARVALGEALLFLADVGPDFRPAR